MQIAIVVSQFNKEISDRLLAGAKKALYEAGFPAKKFVVFEVPGAFEIPFAAAKLADSKKFDGIIALGCVLKGETDHYAAVCGGVTYGIQKIAIEKRIPIMFGVLMCKTKKQALKRSQEIPKNSEAWVSWVPKPNVKRKGGESERSEASSWGKRSFPQNKGYECIKGLMEILKGKL